MKVGNIIRRHSTGTFHKVTEVLASGRIRIDDGHKSYMPCKFTVLSEYESLLAILLGQIGHNTPWQGILRRQAGLPIS